jgi:Rhs element Vgr protein
MPENQTISTPQTADAVTFTIMSEGEAVPASVSVQHISVWQEINRISKARLIILDGDPAAQSFSVSSQEIFIPGKELEIQAGYHSDEETIFKGIVTRQRIKVRQNGTSQLIVECSHNSVKMTHAPKSRYFYDKDESSVWEEILGEHDIAHEVESTDFELHEILQFQATDWDFIVSRAELYGLFVITKKNKLEIKKPDFDQDPSETVSFGSTLLSLDAEMDATSQVTGVVSKTWDFSKTETTEVAATSQNPITPGNIDRDTLSKIFSEEPLTIRNSAKQSDELLQKWADSTLMRHELSKIRGRAQFQGIPQLEAGKVIELQGLGDRFNGKAFISGVRHEIASGNWFVHVQFGLSKEAYASQYDISTRSAAGLLPAISGLQTGVVSQIEGDPEGDDRIKVKLPVVDQDEQGVWARLATPGAGNNRGIVIRPEIDDEVIVGFVNDDPNHPVILGALNSSNLPAPIAVSDDNHKKGWVTRSEIKMVVNDDKKTINIEMPSGKKISVDDDAGEISFSDEHGNSIKMDSDGITMESAKDLVMKAGSGDIKMESMNLNSQAQSEIKLTSNATAELSSSGSTTIKGGVVQIN